MSRITGLILLAVVVALVALPRNASAAPVNANFLVNGDFDDDVSVWTVTSPYLTHDPSVDRWNAASSGSISFLITQDTAFNGGVMQCIPVVEGIPVTLTGWALVPTVSQAPGTYGHIAMWFGDNGTCTGVETGFENRTVSPASGWQQMQIDTVVPPGTHSMLIYANILKAQNSSIDSYGHIDALTLISAGDADGDGCLNGAELGPDPALGGDRNPQDGADFFDVPTPALLPGDASGVRDGQINLADVLAVIAYAGTSQNGAPNPAGAGYDADLNANGTPDGAEYDRTPSQDPAKPWQSGPPDGAVSLADVIVALEQTGHNCSP